MKATVTVSSGLVVNDVEAENTKALFEKIASIYEVFGDTKCGHCKSQNVFPMVRKVEDNNFYEMTCGDCHYKLSYGHAKDGSGMYPKRYVTDAKGKAKKDKNGKTEYLPDNGWRLYVPKDE